MARPRSAGFDGQRDQIMAAAAALFAGRGYTATTMNQVAAACGVSKATLYHYVSDKHQLLASITGGHVARLEALVADVSALKLSPEAHLRTLIERFMQAYAHAQHEHRVLTEDVKFLAEAERGAVTAAQRRVVAAFADAVVAVRPALGHGEPVSGKPADGELIRGELTNGELTSCELTHGALATPLAMLLFGMMNWTFTWLRPGGALTHQTLAPVVAALFLGGLPAVG